MDKNKTFVVNHVIDLAEDASYSLVNSDLENKATVVISGEEMTIYFEDGTPEEKFGKDFGKMMARVQELGLNFIKLMNGNHRWHKFNPNPKARNIGDCTLRSYCAAFGIDWNKAYDIASKIAKDNASMIQYVADKVLIDHFKCEKDDTYKPKAKDRITVNNFAMSHPYGTFILHVRGHQVTVKNGEYWDSWDSGDKKVSAIYKLPKKVA